MGRVMSVSPGAVGFDRQPVQCLPHATLVVGPGFAQDGGMAPPRFHDLRIAARRPETAEAVVLTFDVPPALREAYRFTPGQYLTLRATIEGEDVRRSYSICSGPDDRAPDDWELSVAIKRVDGGLFSNWAADGPAVGDTIQVMTPNGRFGLPGATGSRTVAAFAAGSGITPILSIMRHVLVAEPETRFFLFYGNRATASIMFREAIEDLKDRHLSRLSVFHVLSREQQDVPVLNGRLDAGKARLLLRHVLPAAVVDQALVCGPQPMIEGLVDVLGELGLLSGQVHVERFTPSFDGRPHRASIAPTAAPAAIVTVISEGVRSDIPVAAGEAIIDAALRAGRMLPYSCKGGMCCTCRARVVEGRVEMAVNYSLEPWELAAGFVLTCQSRPVTDRVVVDYDQV
jgi:ring-1,2-phenylacetyl-CoA epoxidase subunit PaaE